jgi:hypothetical protein
MAEGEGTKPITVPPDPVRALSVYWLRADVMLSLVQASEDAWLADAAKHKTEFETYIAFWLSALYVVVDGFRKLKLDASEVPGLSDERVDTLRLFRNGCFHYQPDYEKLVPFLSFDLEAFDWAEQLHRQFGAYFAALR